ncbi:hypothetical protein Leryth_017944 [Lithospermum erythrorhizon]|nr:hypothetical protein Leryth_017944 [Lithospermum erythrorhizon]
MVEIVVVMEDLILVVLGLIRIGCNLVGLVVINVLVTFLDKVAPLLDSLSREPRTGQLRNGTNPNASSYVPSFGSSSWNDPTIPNISKRNCDGDLKTFSSFNGFENQNGGHRNVTPGLIHHLSLPKTSSEIAAVENYLEFQHDDGVL